MIKDREYYINPLSLVTKKEICNILGVCMKTLHTLSKHDNFPKPINFRHSFSTSARGRKYYRYGDIIKFINQKFEEKDA